MYITKPTNHANDVKQKLEKSSPMAEGHIYVPTAKKITNYSPKAILITWIISRIFKTPSPLTSPL